MTIYENEPSNDTFSHKREGSATSPTPDPSPTPDKTNTITMDDEGTQPQSAASRWCTINPQSFAGLAAIPASRHSSTSLEPEKPSESSLGHIKPRATGSGWSILKGKSAMNDEASETSCPSESSKEESLDDNSPPRFRITYSPNLQKMMDWSPLSEVLARFEANKHDPEYLADIDRRYDAMLEAQDAEEEERRKNEEKAARDTTPRASKPSVASSNQGWVTPKISQLTKKRAGNGKRGTRAPKSVQRDGMAETRALFLGPFLEPNSIKDDIPEASQSFSPTEEIEDDSSFGKARDSPRIQQYDALMNRHAWVSEHSPGLMSEGAAHAAFTRPKSSASSSFQADSELRELTKEECVELAGVAPGVSTFASRPSGHQPRLLGGGCSKTLLSREDKNMRKMRSSLLLDTGSDKKFEPGVRAGQCERCGEYIRHDFVLCNDCARLTHHPDYPRPYVEDGEEEYRGWTPSKAEPQDHCGPGLKASSPAPSLPHFSARYGYNGDGCIGSQRAIAAAERDLYKTQDKKDDASATPEVPQIPTIISTVATDQAPLDALLRCIASSTASQKERYKAIDMIAKLMEKGNDSTNVTPTGYLTRPEAKVCTSKATAAQIPETLNSTMLYDISKTVNKTQMMLEFQEKQHMSDRLARIEAQLMEREKSAINSKHIAANDEMAGIHLEQMSHASTIAELQAKINNTSEKHQNSLDLHGWDIADLQFEVKTLRAQVNAHPAVPRHSPGGWGRKDIPDSTPRKQANSVKSPADQDPWAAKNADEDAWAAKDECAGGWGRYLESTPTPPGRKNKLADPFGNGDGWGSAGSQGSLMESFLRSKEDLSAPNAKKVP